MGRYRVVRRKEHLTFYLNITAFTCVVGSLMFVLLVLNYGKSDWPYLHLISRLIWLYFGTSK